MKTTDTPRVSKHLRAVAEDRLSDFDRSVLPGTLRLAANAVQKVHPVEKGCIRRLRLLADEMEAGIKPEGSCGEAYEVIE